nr:folylpolyglutamate synthase/dihydrofolate synthase family protein [Allomuricauda sp.]
MTYQETLSWMFAQLPMYQNKGASALKNKLDNILSLSEVLGNPHEKFKSVHVAGTNGKGSSSHMLASILQEAGYKVGLYTSPHLKDFRERIKINGKPVSKDFVKKFVAAHKAFFETHSLSFFEMTVGMAFSHFANEKVDIAVIEVGLGGRLDSTNIITPEVSLITNIGFDHMEILGNTLEKIALEKAGIIKRNIPVVVSEKQPETEGIFQLIAAQKSAEIVFAEDLDLEGYTTDLLGEYQKRNVLGVLATIKSLKNLKVNKDHIKKGLANVVKNTGLLGRWQILNTKPVIVCDTAHNREGLMAVMQQINVQDFKNLHIVLGFANDKDIGKLLALFPANARYYFVSPNIPRGLPVSDLKEKAMQFNLKGEGYDSVKGGLQAAKKRSRKEDFIFVGGSTFVVAEIV